MLGSLSSRIRSATTIPIDTTADSMTRCMKRFISAAGPPRPIHDVRSDALPMIVITTPADSRMK